MCKQNLPRKSRWEDRGKIATRLLPIMEEYLKTRGTSLAELERARGLARMAKPGSNRSASSIAVIESAG
jgi:hypothetical protein